MSIIIISSLRRRQVFFSEKQFFLILLSWLPYTLFFIKIYDNLQLSCIGWRMVSCVPLNYSIPGHVFATLQCHLVKKGCLKKLYILDLPAIYTLVIYKIFFTWTLNKVTLGGAKVHLSWNNIRWNTGNLLLPHRLQKTQ